MTISNTNRVAVFIGNGVSTVFPFSFPIYESEELELRLYNRADNTYAVIPPMNYSATGIGPDSVGGAVTYNPGGVPIDSTRLLAIYRTVPYTQDTDIRNQAGFYPEVLELQLDKIVMQIQQLAEEVDRAVVIPPTSTVTNEDFVANLIYVGGMLLGGGTAFPSTRLDGSSLQVGDIFVLTGQSPASQNGLYGYVGPGWSKATNDEFKIPVLTPNLNTDAYFAPGQSSSGFFADYDCKGPTRWVQAQAENQSGISGGGFRDLFFAQHIDRDTVDYTAIGQKVSYAGRFVTSGAFDVGTSQFLNQHKDLVGLAVHSIGKVEGPLRGVSGINVDALQIGTGIGSNELAVENPSYGLQASSLAAVQAIVRAQVAADDAGHAARTFLGTNQGHRITAGLQLQSAPNGPYAGTFRYGLDFTLAEITESAIRLRGTGTGATTIEYGPNSYQTFDSVNDRLNYLITGNIVQSLSATGVGFGVDAIGQTAGLVVIAPSTTTAASLYFRPGTGPTSNFQNGMMWYDGSAWRGRTGGATITFQTA